MGRAAAGEIARNLIAAGRPGDTPVLVAVNVSLPNERIIHGRLDALAFLVATISDDDPTLLLVGEATAPPSGGTGDEAVAQPEFLPSLLRTMEPSMRHDQSVISAKTLDAGAGALIGEANAR
jgi:siroheme synthase